MRAVRIFQSEFMSLRFKGWISLISLMLLTGGVWADQVYTVKAGDTLSEIARQFNVSAREIQLYNDLAHPDRIVEGQVLNIPPSTDVPVRYVVMPGDTLGLIARNHGTSVDEVVRLNQLRNPDAIHVGQVLLIPGSTRARRESLPASIRRQLGQVNVRSGWTHIVIHHSGTRQGNVRDMDRYHREQRRMVNGLGYHFVIGNGQGMADGEIAIGPRWSRQQDGGHLASAAQNQYAIGICLIGNFDQTRPTAQQLASLRALVRHLQQQCGIPTSQVTTHTLINVRPTRCPGRHFPTEAFLLSL